VYAGRLGHAGFRDGHRQRALFSAPRGMCADTNGTLIIADSGNACVRRVSTNGELVPGETACSQLLPRLPASVMKFPNMQDSRVEAHTPDLHPPRQLGHTRQI